MTAPYPTDEADRLDALRRLMILDTPPEQAYDDLTRLTSFVCGTPIATVSLIDSHRQWFKSKVGLAACETSRDVAFCAYTILDDDLLLVPDATADTRFRDNPLVTSEPHIRAYAGMPLTTPAGHSLGTLCVIDRVPRTLTPEQQDALRTLGRQVVQLLLLREKVHQLEQELLDRRRLEEALRASETRFRAFMDHSLAVAFMKDEAGRYVYVNEPLVRQFGIPEDGWIGHTDRDIFPEQAEYIQVLDQAVLASDTGVAVLETVPTPAGEDSYWQSYKFPFVDPSGRRFVAGMAVDRTKEKKAEQALRASEAKFRTTVDRLAEGLFVIDVATRRFIEVNASVLAMLGYSAREFLALTPFDIVAGESREAYDRTVEEMDGKLSREGRYDLGRRQLRRKDGSVVHADIKVTVVPDGHAGLHAVIVRDISEQLRHEQQLFEYHLDLERANAKLKALAVTDGLTGVKNRAAFNEKLAEEFERAVRYGHPLSVILMDVDHFKKFNDSFGHPAGDQVLKAVARALADTVRVTDMVARYGGEEYAVILPDTNYAGAMVLAERCRAAVAATPWDKRAVTISVGVSTQMATTADAQALVKEADDALYRSKQEGRNRVNHGSGTFAKVTPACV